MCASAAAASNLIDVQNPLKKYLGSEFFVARCAASTVLFAGAICGSVLLAQPVSPPLSSVGVFPLSSVHRGLTGTAWTVFEGTAPEAMEVEILGVLRGARGPGRDLILARLHGAKPEYTGVVAGMSGSPVYIDGKLAGALSYRIGQFSKEPIAGITPIEQMLEVRDLPQSDSLPLAEKQSEGGFTFSAMETPLLMSGFEPEAIRVWKERMAGTGLEMVSAGGAAGSGTSEAENTAASANLAISSIVPGSAVSLQLVRGDLEIAATCTVTYVDPKQLLACGHPILQSGEVSLPMTSTDVVATLASPLNAFKIVNTGATIGAFTEDRDAAIRGEFGAKARMIPVKITVTGTSGSKDYHMEIADLPSLTPSAMLVSVYQTLLQTNQSSARTSYHVTGEIMVAGLAPVPVEAWGTPGEPMVAQLAAALGVGDSFNRLYANATRLKSVEGVRLHVEAIPEDLRTELESVRLISSSIVHAGDTVVVEATLRRWEQPARNVRLGFTLPARLQPGNLRLLVSGASSLDRTLDASRPQGHGTSLVAASDRLRGLHSADQLYVSLLMPESQASVAGRTLDSLPLSMANTLESHVGLNGESLEVVASTAAEGVLTGQQILSLRVEAGGGLH
jgi:hypothetical protein